MTKPNTQQPIQWEERYTELCVGFYGDWYNEEIEEKTKQFISNLLEQQHKQREEEMREKVLGCLGKEREIKEPNSSDVSGHEEFVLLKALKQDSLGFNTCRQQIEQRLNSLFE